jgi:hypothetical protein
MTLQILKDAEVRPDLFWWRGAIPRAELSAWIAEQGIRLGAELEQLLEQTGGGDMFESETILSPMAGEETGDRAADANAFHHERGLAAELWLFHVGMSFSAIDQRTGRIVTLDLRGYATMDEYETLSDWYARFIRDEYGDYYGLPR